MGFRFSATSTQGFGALHWNIKPNIHVVEADEPQFILQRKLQEASMAIDRFIEALSGNESAL